MPRVDSLSAGSGRRASAERKNAGGPADDRAMAGCAVGMDGIADGSNETWGATTATGASAGATVDAVSVALPMSQPASQGAAASKMPTSGQQSPFAEMWRWRSICRP
ncbi:MAG: hypothetical protein ACOY3P_04585 [Planctomycetota bacterium]